MVLISRSVNDLVSRVLIFFGTVTRQPVKGLRLTSFLPMAQKAALNIEVRSKTDAAKRWCPWLAAYLEFPVLEEERKCSTYANLIAASHASTRT
jgi:hypothetical protein